MNDTVRPGREFLLTVYLDAEADATRVRLVDLETRRVSLLASMNALDRTWRLSGCLVLSGEDDHARLEIIRRLVRAGDLQIRVLTNGDLDYFAGEFIVEAPDQAAALAIARGLIMTAGGAPDGGADHCGLGDWMLYGAHLLDDRCWLLADEGSRALTGNEALTAIEQVVAEGDSDAYQDGESDRISLLNAIPPLVFEPDSDDPTLS